MSENQKMELTTINASTKALLLNYLAEHIHFKHLVTKMHLKKIGASVNINKTNNVPGVN
jgi:hypothetical protein